jgi:nitroreductase
VDVAQAIQTRRSCRLFLDKPVERSLLEEVCRLACLAPSAINLQPWLLTVVHGPELKRLSRRLLQAFEERRLGCVAEAAGPLGEPYLGRQKRLNQEVEIGRAHV